MEGVLEKVVCVVVLVEVVDMVECVGVCGGVYGDGSC